jgi:mevalonate kinase
MSSASAPGKIILFGEHAVVYGRPALAVPVRQVQATAEVEASSRSGVWIAAPDIGLASELAQLASDQPLAAAVRGVFSALGIAGFPAIQIRISSSIPVASGLGSGAAVSVALIRALSAHLGQPLSDEQVSALTFEIEKLHHGTPSGIDNTVVTYARPVYFVKGQPPETFKVGAPFTIVIGDTGVAASTKAVVSDVRQLWQTAPRRWEDVFDRVGKIARQARAAIESGDLSALGPLMDANQALLRIMSVSSPELERLLSAARAAGAQGAKLSGGGRGGNMIALAPKEKAPAVAEALLSAGAKRTIITQV